MNSFTAFTQNLLEASLSIQDLDQRILDWDHAYKITLEDYNVQEQRLLLFHLELFQLSRVQLVLAKY